MKALSPITVTAFFIAVLSAAACGHGPKGEPISPRDGVFAIEDTAVGVNEVRFYRYETGGKTVVFFVARASSGEIKTAFDACETCYPHRMGYRHEKDCVVCAYCGMPIKIEDLEKGVGNCVPVTLRSRRSGGMILISQQDVEGGAKLF